MQRNWKNDLLIILLFFVLTAILYWNARYAGMVMDYTGWLEKFDGKQWTDVFTCFGFPANQQVAIGFLFLMVKTIGQHELTWSLVYWGFHAVNAFLLYRLLRYIFEIFEIRASYWRGLTLALLWLCCCYQGEVVVWKVTQNYFLLALFNLLMIHAYFKYFLEGNKIQFWLATILFGIGLFTFEQALVNIAFVTVVYALLLWSNKISFHRKPVIRVLLPMVSFLMLYFVISFIWIGDWVGHYGSEAHLSMDFGVLASNYAKFLLKYLIYWRSFHYSAKELFVHSMDSWSWVVLFIVVGIQILSFRFRNKSEHSALLSLFFLVITLLMFLPVANLHMVWQGVSSGDRYGYFSSMFYFPWLAMLLYQWKNNYQVFAGIILLVVNVSLLGYLTQAWKSNQYLNERLTEAYKWEEEDLVLFLNSPDNFNNTFLFIDKAHHGFQDALEYYGRKNIKGEVYDVIQYNMLTVNDGVSVERVRENEYKVLFNQWGNWWFHEGIGAEKKIDCEYYSLEIEDWYYYRLKLKPAAKDAVLIYQDGPELKEVRR